MRVLEHCFPTCYKVSIGSLTTISITSAWLCTVRYPGGIIDQLTCLLPYSSIDLTYLPTYRIIGIIPDLLIDRSDLLIDIVARREGNIGDQSLMHQRLPLTTWRLFSASGGRLQAPGPSEDDPWRPIAGSGTCKNIHGVIRAKDGWRGLLGPTS